MRRLLVAALLCSFTAFATSSPGPTGRSGKPGTTTCSSCHAQAGAAASVVVTGPSSLAAGAIGTFTVRLTGGPGVRGGLNVAADNGTFTQIDSSARVDSNEVRHSQPKNFADGGVSWSFRWTAPATVGTAKLYTAAQSVDGTGGTSGDKEALSVTTITVTAPNQAPTVANAAASSPATVTGTTANLSVLGADDQPESALVYTWSVTGPAGATVSFSQNATNAAKNTVATFTRAGAYVFTASIKDANNATVTSTVNVTVTPVYTSVKTTPATTSLPVGAQLTLSAQGLDQFAQPVVPAIPYTWSAPAGAGTVTPAGVYTAPNTAGGPHTLTAAGGGKSGTSAITVVTGSPPTIAVAAKAVLNGETALDLSVLGADDSGEAKLKYTWASTGPAVAVFSANGTNAAKAVKATLSRAGSYSFTVTATDLSGLSATSTVSATVEANLTSVTVTPAAKTLLPNESQQFTAAAVDQFGRPFTPAPTLTWTVNGGGSVTTSGLFTAGNALGGPYLVRAVAGAKSSTSTVTIANGGVPLFVEAPSATPSTVTGRTTQLRAKADDELGESALTYTWAATGPSPVVFAPNGSNGAKVSMATFAESGTYQLAVTATDADGKSDIEGLTVEVVATAERIEVTPSFAVVKGNGSAKFAAKTVDQFGEPFASATPFTWSTGSAGALAADGTFTARGVPGTFSVIASQGALRGAGAVRVDTRAPVSVLEGVTEQMEANKMVALKAKVTDDLEVKAVRFFVDGKLLEEDDEAPYEAGWATVTSEDKTFALEVEAEDTAGNLSRTAPVKVEVKVSGEAPTEAPRGCSAAPGGLLGLIALLGLARRWRAGPRSGPEERSDAASAPATRRSREASVS